MRGKNTISLMRLKRMIVKVSKCMRFLHQITPILPSNELRSDEYCNGKPISVPKGHFVVLAGKRENESHEEESRFVVELKYLRSPSVLNLLKEAEEEYGFHQEGALVLPCTPQHLHQILKDI